MAAVKVDRERLMRTFLDLVAIDSPTGQEQVIGEELERRFTALGTTVRRDEAGNLIATLEGPPGECFLISTHMDTVGTDVGIKPIVGDDGVIRTDGSTILGADDKAGIASCLELLTLLGEHPELPHPAIEFVVSVSEEAGLVGSRQLDVSRLRSTHGYVFDTAGAVGSITYWAPTALDVNITVHGRKAHAGVEPEKGVDALRVAAEAIAAMPLGRIDEETVAGIGILTSGEARNVVPATAVLTGQARSHDQAKLDAQVAAMRDAVDAAARRHGATYEFVAEEIYHTYHIDPVAKPYRDAARAIEANGLEVIARKSGGGTDGNFLNARGIPCVGLATGMVDEHATSEHIAIDDMVAACGILLTIATGTATAREQ
ncbi:M20/M25/M40 family metallo-hydrolase [Actinoplanes sp. NPDC049802]|uniref:M20/M25/M40 family metallo-hydrolase n=1 Tax=Actinoplanes sp. NPDC049802 TaxID=3154742 RepID=UPI0033F7D76A